VVAKAGVVYVVGAVGKPGGFTMDANDRPYQYFNAIALLKALRQTPQWIKQ